MFTRIKIISGKPYLYETQSYRAEGKVHHKSKYIRKATEDDIAVAKLKTLLREDRQKTLSNAVDVLLVNLAKSNGCSVSDLSAKNTPNLRGAIKLIPWFQENKIPVCNLRVKKSDKRGTLNNSMVYQLSRVSDDRQRMEVYKFIKMRKVRRADRLREIVNNVLLYNRHRQFVPTSGINKMTQTESERAVS